ncbi:large conductance mechanosensitive channel protein MscL [Gemmata sp.]|uniref:large conductance mechanosensitive channel protein MscL n=1 Tax=Gemmata sp. TaxID=1914242 RepID=UPI003F727658
MPVLEEFKKFILRGNVVDLAVGVVIGAAFTKVIDSVVADLFMPVVGVLTGGIDVSQMRLTLYGDASIGWGRFAQSVLNFLIIGFCMFLVVKGINALHRYVLKAEAAVAAPEPTATEKLLTEIRDLLKDQKSGPVA